MRTFCGYFIVDIKRALISVDYVKAVLLSVLVLVFSFLEVKEGFLNANVFDSFLFEMDLAPHLIILSTVIICYGTVFVSEKSYKYYREEIRRGSINQYIISKLSSVFISTWITAVSSLTFFVLALHTVYPWMNDNSMGYYEDVIESKAFAHQLVGKGYIFLYLFLWILFYSVLPAIIAMVSCLLSMFVSNTMFVIVTPVALFYFIEEFLGTVIMGFSLERMFHINYNAPIVLNEMIAVSVTFIVVFLLIRIILGRKMRSI